MQHLSKASWALRVGFLMASVILGAEAATYQDDPYAPRRFGIPDTIGGLAVLAVITENNSVCTKHGERRLFLQSLQPTIEAALRSYPKEQSLLAQWEATIVGPGVKRQQVIDQLTESYRLFKIHGCPTLKLPRPKVPVLASAAAQTDCVSSGSSGGEIKCQTPEPGLTIIQNGDVGPNSNGQSVILNAPDFRDAGSWKWPTCPALEVCFTFTGGFSALLNNVLTDQNYFMQVGLYFTRRDDPLNDHLGNTPQSASACVGLPTPDPGNPFSPNGVGWIVYGEAQIVTGKEDVPAQALCVPYNAGHDYYTTITYKSGTWLMCAADNQDPSTYRCHQSPHATGQHLQTHLNTSVFFENWNKEGDSTSGLPPQIVAYGARNYDIPPGNPWSKEIIWTKHSCKDSSWPAQNAVVGGLIHDPNRQFNDETAFFNVGYMPPYC